MLVIPVLLFGLIWYAYAVNIPKWDDHALRAFLYNYDKEPTWAGKIYQLFRQHNEHRIVYDRIVTALDYRLFGKLNYVHLMLVGNLSLVGLLAVFMATLRRSRAGVSGQWVFYSLPVAWLLFNLSQWENMFWGMAALQNFSVVLWVVAAFYFLSYTTHWKLAFLAGVLATITSGNGLMVWPIGFLILLLRLPVYASQGNRTPLAPLLGWLIGAAVVVGLYFVGFAKPGDAKYVKPGIIDLGKGWLAVLGAAAEAVPVSAPLRSSILLGGLLVLATVGIIIWSLVVHRFALGKRVQNLLSRTTKGHTSAHEIPSVTVFFWSCAAFILGTAAVVAWARTGAGIDLLITSRYKMYSLTALALLYVYGVVNLNERVVCWWMITGIVGSVLFAMLSYFSFLDETIWWRHWLTTNQFNWTHTTNTPAFSSDSVSQNYSLPSPAFYDKALPVLYGSAGQPVVNVQTTKTNSGYSVHNTTIPALGLGDAGAYLLARSGKRTYLFPVWQKQQSIFTARFAPGNLFVHGFEASILSAEMEAGTYQLFILTVSDKGKYDLHPTNQTIVSSGPLATETVKNW
ncbi:hypothetical protein CWM47_07645 [Spirosoma pollinicola]|uniref:Glycosyltransferase RgtA/B/C/D-like domain-containing protein n=1 Tax=Spirosoma pollinicola TaxID=2057025 RepID=A0A2K8ZBL9_9BACT|nr:hypothetical protein CWM47_07645 [Spirosoma pollinicola]